MSPRAMVPLLLLSACVFDTSNFAPAAFEDAGRLDAEGTGVDASNIDAALADAGDVDAEASDAAPDATPDATPCIDILLGFTPVNMGGCDPLNPLGSLTISGVGAHSLDTNTGILTAPGGGTSLLPFVVVSQAGGPDLFVTTATDFTIDIGADVELTGSRPLVLIATGTMTINGRLTALGRSTVSGAGGNLDGNCSVSERGALGVVQSNGGNDGGSGGGGGGFGAAGGQGALVDNTGGANSAGGTASTDTDLVPLRGGCAGGSGGLNGGAGGGAGGAMQLVAGVAISHSGAISVSGGGGQGAIGTNSGGAGGGSGGGLILQAPSITGLGPLTANGGGGGEGSRGSGTTGNGTDGFITVEIQAGGGVTLSSGGNGGSGGTLAATADNGLQGNSSGGNLAGGGGGGGAAGRVLKVTP